MEPMLRRLIGEDIELDGACWRRVCDRVKADPGQIEQVIMNLAVNARDAMPQRRAADDRDRERGAGRGVRASDTSRHRRRARTCMLAVSDTGTGMDAADAARGSSSRSSRPRSRARAPASAWRPSTASSSRAAAHLRSTARSGQGTTFKVYLPRAADEPAAERPSRPPARSVPRRDETVLLVEDEDDVRALTLRDPGARRLHRAAAASAAGRAGSWRPRTPAASTCCSPTS